MIIDQCRKPALRRQGGVPGCAGRPRVEGGALSAAAGPAHPISSPALRAAAVRPGERLPLTGVQVIDPHSNLAMREIAAARQARAAIKRR